jgi:hypothetical protein
MDRMIGGRLNRVRAGLPWCGNPPQGRAFRYTGKNSGEWYVTEKGLALRELLTRYANGEALADLGREYGYKSTQIILYSVRNAQLSGTYRAKFNCKELGITNELIPIPQIPEVISPELEQRVRDRMAHNLRWNRTDVKRYPLTGFIRCGCCGVALCGYAPKGRRCYKHCPPLPAESKNCGYRTINADFAEHSILDYLFRTFLDEAAFNEAVQRVAPTTNDRSKVEAQHAKCAKALAEVERKIENLANALANGVDPAMVVATQGEILEQKNRLIEERRKLEDRIAEMPTPETLAKHATYLRVMLVYQIKDRDWTTLPLDEIKRFLHFLFGSDPRRAGNGIFVMREGKSWRVTFKGVVNFHHEIIDGTALDHAFLTTVDAWNEKVRRDYQPIVNEAQALRRTRAEDLVSFIR